MREIGLNKVAGLWLVSLLIACPSMTVTAGATTVQQPVATTADASVPAKSLSRQPKAPVLARNSAATAKAEATVDSKKARQDEGKSTISRCWKRLMDNVREVTKAHRNKQ